MKVKLLALAAGLIVLGGSFAFFGPQAGAARPHVFRSSPGTVTVYQGTTLGLSIMNPTSSSIKVVGHLLDNTVLTPDTDQQVIIGPNTLGTMSWECGTVGLCGTGIELSSTSSRTLYNLNYEDLSQQFVRVFPGQFKMF
jgi:hypothetical protein